MKKTLAIATVIALLVPMAAFAQSSQEAYGGPNNVVAGIEESGGNPPGDNTAPGDNAVVAAEDSGSLPFTGFEFGVVAAVGGLMLMLGFGLRRLTQRSSQV